MEVDKGLATLIAAIIAAFLSFVNLAYRSRSKSKAAYRELLNDVVNELSQAIHETVAISNVIVKTSTNEALENWRKKGSNAKSNLKELTYKTRYSLYGLEKGMRTLSRLPDWAEHKRHKPEEYEPLLKKAGQLKYWLDYSIRKSYFDGTSPSLFQKLMVKYAETRLRKSYNRKKKSDNN